MTFVRTFEQSWGAIVLAAACTSLTACSDDASAGDAASGLMPSAGAGGVAGASATAGSGGVGAGSAGVSGAVGSDAGSGGVGGTGGGSAFVDAGSAIGDGGVDADVPGPGGPIGSGPGDWEAGDYPPDLMGASYLEIRDVPGQAGNVRQYKVHVPPSYDPEVPTPLVFCFHGLGQDPILFCVNGSNMVEKSDAEGFILVMPFGFQNSWNAGTCCGGAATSRLDEVALVRAIFDEVKSHVNVDLSRVYATGLSNGGYMSYRLASAAADIFAAVAPGAGAIGMDDIGGGTNPDGDFEACEPSQPVSVLHIHGTADFLVPYSTYEPSLERIAGKNGCGLRTGQATQPASGGDTECVSYDCPDGIDVTGCTVTGGGHVWFGNDSCGTGAGAFGCGIVGANSTSIVNTDVIWEFFEAHPR